MAIVVTRFVVRRSQSVFNLKALYQHLHEWAVENEFTPSEKDADFPETLYYDARLPEGKSLWIWWRLKQVPQGNPFYRKIINLDWHTTKIKDVEIIHNGKKHKMQQGEIVLSCQALLETDYDNQWRNSRIMSFFYESFWKRFFWPNLEKHKEELKADADNLKETIKRYLDIFSSVSQERPFRPPKGLTESDY
ncbi:hypothetical protein D6764_03140 [Candidatus Woesearchaeota archaeon]|nr:MAG: hypothetical protein D6764_03140 [Candidatus Woesearchaeota archaeon]